MLNIDFQLNPRRENERSERKFFCLGFTKPRKRKSRRLDKVSRRLSQAGNFLSLI